MNVIVTGTLGFDYIMDFPGKFADRIMPEAIHKISLGFIVDKLTKQFGGTAGNIAYSLKLLGLDPLILAPAGNGFAPYLTHLKKHHISTKGISIHKDVPTSSYFVVTDQDDNQIGSFYLGATKYAKDISVFQEVLSLGERTSYDKLFVIIAPTDPAAMKKYVMQCQASQIPYLYDPAFQIATFTPEELRTGIEKAAILIGNDYEITLIEQKLEISHEELRTMVPIVITTLGSKGSIIETRNENVHIKPAKPKNTSDPTGAGDAFRAGFLAGYLKSSFARHRLAKLNSNDLVVCGQMGSVAAAYTVETYGTQTHYFTKKEFIQRYKMNYHETISL